MKVYALLGVVLLILATVSATGCGGVPTVAAPRGDLDAAQGRSDEDRELKEETMTPMPGPEAAEITPPPEAEQVVELAEDELAEKLGLSPEEIRLVSVEAVEWSDASLGCPQPGMMMYAQVITPGFRVTLEAVGQTYGYHTDTGRLVVLCGEDGLTVYPLIPVEPGEIKDGKPWMSNHR